MTSLSATSENVTVAVLNFNGEHHLDKCLTSIQELSSPPAEVILVDDGSTDRSLTIVEERFADIRICSMGENTKRLNKVRNRALREAETRLVLLVDNDVHLAPDCLDELLQAIGSLPNASACMPRALYDHDPSIIYQDGQVLHFVGTTHALNRNAIASLVPSEPRLSIGWGVQLIDCQRAERVGYFNEDYVMGWGDDGEFNHRMNLAGNSCYHVPKAVVYHRRVKPAARFRGSIANRWRFIGETYQLRTILLCLPALIAYEISMATYLTVTGRFSDYIGAQKDIARSIPGIIRNRRAIQSTRALRDVELMTGGAIFVPNDYIGSRGSALALRFLDSFLRGYWRLLVAVS